MCKQTEMRSWPKWQSFLLPMHLLSNMCQIDLPLALRPMEKIICGHNQIAIKSDPEMKQMDYRYCTKSEVFH